MKDKKEKCILHSGGKNLKERNYLEDHDTDGSII
jgi:hypothetical protein